MKGYKVFNSDWTCRGKQYAVGEVATQDGKLEICWNGIHFCTELADCFHYYNADPDNKLAEVEALGNILQSNEDSKYCTNRLKVVKELSITELLKDKDFCIEVVKRSPEQIRFMKEQDLKVFLTAVQQNGKVLGYIPDVMKTPEICMTAVTQSGPALIYVPEDMKTEELCLAAVQNNGWALKYVPERLKTRELCLAAVQNNGWALEYIPEHLKTGELCMIAVQQEGKALEYVSESLKTPEICEAAVRQNPTAVRHVKNRKLRAQLMDMGK